MRSPQLGLVPGDGRRRPDRLSPQPWTPGLDSDPFGFAFLPPGSTVGSGPRGVAGLGKGRSPPSPLTPPRDWSAYARAEDLGEEAIRYDATEVKLRAARMAGLGLTPTSVGRASAP